jgi:DNA-binding IclR family transcriptional regulator
MSGTDMRVSIRRLTRRRGYATDDEETALAMCCFGAPVRGRSGEVVAAVSISMMKVHVDSRVASAASRFVMQLANLLSARLGAEAQPARHSHLIAT